MSSVWVHLLKLRNTETRISVNGSSFSSTFYYKVVSVQPNGFPCDTFTRVCTMLWSTDTMSPQQSPLFVSRPCSPSQTFHLLLSWKEVCFAYSFEKYQVPLTLREHFISSIVVFHSPNLLGSMHISHVLVGRWFCLCVAFLCSCTCSSGTSISSLVPSSWPGIFRMILKTLAEEAHTFCDALIYKVSLPFSDLAMYPSFCFVCLFLYPCKSFCDFDIWNITHLS